METITLPCFGIVLELNGHGHGSITSELHEDPFDENDDTCDLYNSGMDAIESLILAHACAGIDVTTPAYIQGIETAVQACADNM